MVNENESAPSWDVAHASVRGSSHRSSAKPNQDAVMVLSHPRLVVALADGHGSTQSPRSDLGAQMAVQIATDAAAALDMTAEPLADIMRSLATRIVSEWASAVRAHDSANPLTADERRELRDPDSPERDILRPYGSTLVVAVHDGNAFGFIQLGDGDVVVRTVHGEVLQPMPVDDTLIAGETTSLCLENADRHVRIGVVDLEQHPVDFVLLATDGYANAFADPGWRLDVAADMANLLRERGVEWIRERLEGWITESAEVGGDDVSVALIVGPERGLALGAVAPVAPTLTPVAAAVAPVAAATATVMEPSSDSSSPVTTEVLEQVDAPSLVPPPEPRRRRWGWAIVGGVLLLASGGVAVLAVANHGDDGEPTPSTLTTLTTQATTGVAGTQPGTQDTTADSSFGSTAQPLDADKPLLAPAAEAPSGGNDKDDQGSGGDPTTLPPPTEDQPTGTTRPAAVTPATVRSSPPPSTSAATPSTAAVDTTSAATTPPVTTTATTAPLVTDPAVTAAPTTTRPPRPTEPPTTTADISSTSKPSATDPTIPPKADGEGES